MTEDQFADTSIGADYLKEQKYYPVDMYLDYLLGLVRMREEHIDNDVWRPKYDNEIEATKEILKIITK